MVIQETRRRCDYCNRYIPRGRKVTAKYCTPEHQKVAAERRRRARRAAERGKVPPAPVDLTDQQSWRMDSIIDAMVRNGYDVELAKGTMTMEQVKVLLDVSARSQISRAFKELERRNLERLASETWSREDRVTFRLALDLAMPDLLDEDNAWKWANEAADRFLDFEQTYMALPNGDPWIREEFHRTWIVEILFAIATGGYLQILSPPRHGKTELLTHFVVWLICRNPNIRIIWMGPNEEKSKEVIAKVKEILEFNHRLVEDTLPPGITYAPTKRTGAVWQSAKFKVANRATGISGNTVLGIGRGGKILSLNADIIIGDDIEDHDSTESEKDRMATRRWFTTQLDSRKEEHTALFLIGSRQHIDDLYSYNIEDPNFRVVINSMHKKGCPIPENTPDSHIDCMLFPQLRSFRWMLTKKYGAKNRAGDDEGAADLFEMVYLNDPSQVTYTVFTEAVVEPVFNPARRLGLNGIPSAGRRTIAGLDPSATGFQVGWVWAVTPVDGVTGSRLEVQDQRMKRWMVDYDNRLGGGVEAFLEVAKLYLKLYDVRYWVIEDNGFQYLYLDDPRTKSWAQANDVHMEGHQTDTNKYDKVYGLSAMKRYFVDNLIDLPYGDAEAKRKTDLYAKQLYQHVDDPSKAKRKNKTDIKMAAWFPTKTIRRWEKEAAAEADRQRTRTDNPYPSSYPQLNGFSNRSTAPWRN